MIMLQRRATRINGVDVLIAEGTNEFGAIVVEYQALGAPKTALPLAVIGAVVAELFGGVAGLGFVIQSAGTDAALAFAAVALLGTMSITLFYLLAAIERGIAPWIRHVTA